jgi:hypothetical protein
MSLFQASAATTTTKAHQRPPCIGTHLLSALLIELLAVVKH